jgi:hypothetical protein
MASCASEAELGTGISHINFSKYELSWQSLKFTFRPFARYVAAKKRSQFIRIRRRNSMSVREILEVSLRHPVCDLAVPQLV